MDQLYEGHELQSVMQHKQTATCVAGTYIGYTISMFDYDNGLIWANGKPFDQVDYDSVFFRYSRWKINVDESTKS